MVSMAIMVASFRVSLDALARPGAAGRPLSAHRNAAAIRLICRPQDEARIAALPGVRRAEFLRIEQLLLDPGGRAWRCLRARSRRDDPGGRLPLVGERAPCRARRAAARVGERGDGRSLRLSRGRGGRAAARGQVRRFTVAGIWRDYARQQGSVIIERDRYIALTGDRNVHRCGAVSRAGREPRGDIAGDTRAAFPAAPIWSRARPARSARARSRCSTAPSP